MFGKKKDSEIATLNESVDAYKKLLDEAITEDPITRNILSSVSYYVPRSTSISTSCGCSTPEPCPTVTVDPELQYKMYSLMREIHAKITGTMNYVNAIKRIADVLDSFECPAAECKACKHYTPGRVDGCDKNTAIAEFLVAHRIVEVPLDKSPET